MRASCSRSIRAAIDPRAFWGAYAASKAALAALATTLADEWETRANLRINAVVPGPMRSPLRTRTHPGEDRDVAAADRGAGAALPASSRRSGQGRQRRAHRRSRVARGSAGRATARLVVRLFDERPPVAQQHAQPAKVLRAATCPAARESCVRRTPARAIRPPDDRRDARADVRIVENRAVARPAIARGGRQPAIVAPRAAAPANAAAGAAPEPADSRHPQSRAARQRRACQRLERQRATSALDRGTARRRSPRTRYARGAARGAGAAAASSPLIACRAIAPSIGRSAERGATSAISTSCRRAASQVSTTVSGLSDMLSMPCSTSHCARSGWSDGPCPQMPTYLPGLAARGDRHRQHRLDRVVALVERRRRSRRRHRGRRRASAASCRWSRSRSRRNARGSGRRGSAFDGISHIMITRSPLRRARGPAPSAARSPSPLPSSVRTNGIISSTLVKPIVVAHALHRRALEREAVVELRRDVARRAAEARASDSPRAARSAGRRRGSSTRST